MAANLPKSSTRGGVLAANDQNWIAALADKDAAHRHLPMWTEWGVVDAGVLIHSLGVTWMTLVGDHANLMSVTELPAPAQGRYGRMGDDVRSDAVWFDRTTHHPVMIGEFERYSGIDKDLSPKVQSLVLAHHRWGAADALLVLAYWTTGLATLPNHAALRAIASDGFQVAGLGQIEGIPKLRMAFLQHIMIRGKDGLLRLDQIIQRGVA
jgi:hypothetical protein